MNTKIEIVSNKNNKGSSKVNPVTLFWWVDEHLREKRRCAKSYKNTSNRNSLIVVVVTKAKADDSPETPAVSFVQVNDI